MSARGSAANDDGVGAAGIGGQLYLMNGVFEQFHEMQDTAQNFPVAAAAAAAAAGI
jgi:hypothetical protein